MVFSMSLFGRIFAFGSKNRTGAGVEDDVSSEHSVYTDPDSTNKAEYQIAAAQAEGAGAVIKFRLSY